ncbi:MAG TPA: hypothetical protein VKU02_29875 [Gemmataceae bacterium]|nr:hypothetical protein [Gemmataceae bacterium]
MPYYQGGSGSAYPVLSYLDRIDGVASSQVNESGTHLRLFLRPGADPKKVAGAVQRVLSEQTKELIPVPLAGAATAAAMQKEQWQDKNQLAESAASETASRLGRTPILLIALFLIWLAIGLCLLWWWYRRKSAENHGEALCPNSP